MVCSIQEVTRGRKTGRWQATVGRTQVVSTSKDAVRRARELLVADEAVRDGLLAERRSIVAALEGVDVPTDAGLGAAVLALVEDLQGATSGLRALSGRATVAIRIARVVEERLDELPASLAEALRPELHRLSCAEVVEGCPIAGRVRRLVDGIVRAATHAGGAAIRLANALGTDEVAGLGQELGEASARSDQLRRRLFELLEGRAR